MERMLSEYCCDTEIGESGMKRREMLYLTGGLPEKAEPGRANPAAADDIGAENQKLQQLWLPDSWNPEISLC
jgi:hypothetical protein